MQNTTTLLACAASGDANYDKKMKQQFKGFLTKKPTNFANYDEKKNDTTICKKLDTLGFS